MTTVPLQTTLLLRGVRNEELRQVRMPSMRAHALPSKFDARPRPDVEVQCEKEARQMTSTSIAVTATFIAAVWAAVPARAQEVEDTIQVGLITPLFSYATATTESDDTGVEVDTKSISWGIREDVALVVGYGLSEMFVFGGVLDVGGSSDMTEVDAPGSVEQESSTTTLFVGPKLDVVFAEGSDMRPFIGVAPGLTIESYDISNIETSMAGFELQVRGGLRWFPVRGLSLDPSFVIGWATTAGDVESAGVTTDVSGSAISFAAALGVSAWIP